MGKNFVEVVVKAWKDGSGWQYETCVDTYEDGREITAEEYMDSVDWDRDTEQSRVDNGTDTLYVITKVAVDDDGEETGREEISEMWMSDYLNSRA